jgi:membrane associated rhomboid family serine protease
MTERLGSPLLDLLAVFAVVYAVQFVADFTNVLSGLFVLSDPVSDRPWTVLTSVYAHAGINHLLTNAAALVVFGYAVAAATTRLRFHLFFAVTGAIAGVSQILLTDVLAELPMVDTTASAGVLGASGAVFALLGYLLASNRLVAGLGLIARVPRWLTSLVFVVLALALTYVTASAGAALVAHFTGLLLGLVAGQFNILRPSTARSPQPTTETTR